MNRYSKLLISFSILFCLSTGVTTGIQAQSKEAVMKSSSTTKVKTVSLDVDGMTCQKGCADGIDKKLKKVNGVIKSQTSLASAKSVVTFDENIISVHDIIAVIDKKGYKAKLADKE